MKKVATIFRTVISYMLPSHLGSTDTTNEARRNRHRSLNWLAPAPPLPPTPQGAPPMRSQDRPLPPHATDESRRRFLIARRLAESCPVELGDEIAVTGSVALGVADDTSDIELNLWCDALPTVEQRAAWVASVGGAVRSNHAQPWSDGSLETTFRVEGVWVEAIWMTKARLEATLRELLAAATIDHGRLQMGWVVGIALELRTAGWLDRWRGQLAAYPEALREKLIEANTLVWQ